jgi:hypothetical protein
VSHDQKVHAGEQLDLRLLIGLGDTIGYHPDLVEAEFVFDLHLVVQGETLYAEPQLTTVANGVAMTLQSVEIMPTTVKMHLCYELPSYDDWMLDSTELLVGDYLGVPGGGSWLGGKTALTDLQASGQRNLCIETIYSVGLAGQEIPTKLQYTVGRLKTSWPEAPSQEELERAYRRLGEKGIEMKFIFDDHGISFDIQKRPDDWEESEVNRFIFDSLCDWHEGPWVFKVDLSEATYSP